MNENIIKQTCKELGITQKELAERMGVSVDTISNWSTAKTYTPKWALELFRLMILEKNMGEINAKANQIIEIASTLKSE